jgi:hypothetical protein
VPDVGEGQQIDSATEYGLAFLLHPSCLHGPTILNRPSAVPRLSGVYAWYSPSAAHDSRISYLRLAGVALNDRFH